MTVFVNGNENNQPLVGEIELEVIKKVTACDIASCLPVFQCVYSQVK